MGFTSSETIGVGFLGAGDVSTLHARAVARCPGAKLVGLWNRNPDRAASRAAEFGCRTYDSPAALVADPAIQAVFVLTNLETHLELAELAMRAGKHVLVEKPVGASLAEIDRMAATAAAAGVVCMPGHNYIYEAGMARTKELVAAGDLGRVCAVYVLYNIRHAEEIAKRYPGVVRQILTHHAYILLYLAGEPAELCAMKATLSYQEYTEEDLAMVQVRLKSGALAHLEASFAADDHAADPWTVMVKVIGTGGSTRYSYRDHVEVRAGSIHSQTYSAYQGSIVNEVRYFLTDCLRDGAAPLSTLADAATAQRLIEACEASIHTGRVVPV